VGCLTACGVFAATLTLTPSQDVNIADGYNANANLNGPFTELLVNWGCDPADPTCDQPQTSQSLIQFDLSAIPVGATINSATLRLFHSINDGSGDAFELYRNTSAWDETTTTYNTRPSADPAAVGSFVIGDNAIGVYREADVTGVVSDWHSGTFPNFGLTLRQINETPVGWIYIDSKESGVDPELVVDYTPAAVPEPSTMVLLACGAVALLLRKR
jgi:hypothetical protein